MFDRHLLWLSLKETSHILKDRARSVGCLQACPSTSVPSQKASDVVKLYIFGRLFLPKLCCDGLMKLKLVF